MRARLRDTELYFDVEGTGLTFGTDGETQRPVAFMIHGGPGGDHSSLRSPFSPLASAMQLVYFDHRGQGRSARGDPQRYTLDENVADMEALRLHLGLDKIVSIGTSYGGLVAMAHAIRYPESVSDLVLIATFCHSGHRDRALEIADKHGSAEQQAMARALFDGDLHTSAQCESYFSVMQSLYSVTAPDKTNPSFRSYPFSPEPLNRAFGQGGFLRKFDLRPELHRITARTLILAGRQDWICAPEFSEEIHALIPSSELTIFEKSGHSVRLDRPGGMINRIKEFLGLD